MILAIRPQRSTRSASTSESSMAMTSSTDTNIVITPVISRKPPTPLLVTLSSATLTRPVLGAKIKLGKLHTSQISVDLIDAAGPRGQLSPSLINTEYLPHDLHRLKIGYI